MLLLLSWYNTGLLITVADKQVGCGAGNTIFPLVATYPDIFVHACDFSPRAVDLVKVSFYFLLFFLICTVYC